MLTRMRVCNAKHAHYVGSTDNQQRIEIEWRGFLVR
jgi:hypothetical protein